MRGSVHGQLCAGPLNAFFTKKHYVSEMVAMRHSFLKVTVIVLAVVIILILLLLAAVLVKPGLYVRFKQSTGMVTGEVNSYQPKEAPVTEVMDNGIRYQSNIAYGTDYPNSFLDLYLNPDSENKLLPTFFYIHGGGFAWGDKAEGDPTASTSDVRDATKYLQEICASGYNVVSMNYALAPEYVYPTPILQIDQAVRFLRQNEETYGLDMSRIVFSGGSAGGQLAGQYVNLQTNPDYAAAMGLEQTVPKEEILGVVFSCALFKPQDFAKTGDWHNDFMFHALQKTYWGMDEAALQEADVIKHLTADFPATYMTDGNYGTFDEQMSELSGAMSELAIPYVYNYCGSDEVKLGHGYDSFLDDPYAQDNLRKVLEFLRNQQSH